MGREDEGQRHFQWARDPHSNVIHFSTETLPSKAACGKEWRLLVKTATTCHFWLCGRCDFLTSDYEGH